MGSSANDVADYLADIAYLKKTIRDDPSKQNLANAIVSVQNAADNNPFVRDQYEKIDEAVTLLREVVGLSRYDSTHKKFDLRELNKVS